MPDSKDRKKLNYDEYKLVRDFMESPMTLDSQNSSDQIKLDPRSLVQQMRTRFRNAGLETHDIRIAGDLPVNVLKKATFRNRKIRIIFNMTPPPKVSKPRHSSTQFHSPEKATVNREMKEMDSAIIGIHDGPIQNSTPKVKKHAPNPTTNDAPIDHNQRWKLIKDVVAQILVTKVLQGTRKHVKPPTTKDIQKSYFLREQQVINDQDNWGVITINNKRGRNVELLFIGVMRRQYEFSVDSFQIVLDPYLSFADVLKDENASEESYPNVTVLSLTGNLQKAIRDLEHRLIVTVKPEEIHGGGLLRYCYLSILPNFRQIEKINLKKKLQAMMCSRFFIDHKSIGHRSSQINYFLEDQFGFESDILAKFDFLMTLEAVVEQSATCLLHHEQHQMVALIAELAAQAHADILHAEGFKTNRPASKELLKAAKTNQFEIDINNNEIGMASLQLMPQKGFDSGCYSQTAGFNYRPQSGPAISCHCSDSFSGPISGQYSQLDMGQPMGNGPWATGPSINPIN